MTTLQAAIDTRQKKLRTATQDTGLDGIVINPSPSLSYVTGLHFHLSERPVILFFPNHGIPSIVLPKLEVAKLKEIKYPLKSFPYDENPACWAKSFSDAIHHTSLKNKRIGIESRYLRVMELNLLKQAAPQAEFIASDESIAGIRMIKDETEINSMRQAVRIAQEALQATLPKINLGVSEIEIANELTLQLLTHGSKSQLPFSPIVSSGPNSANPHTAPSGRKITNGDLLVIDYGANVDGYFSDITRTFAIGSINPELRKISNVVLAANQAGHAVAFPGVPISAVDQAARDVIEDAGYGKFFIHRTGHGLGLESHEEPYIRADNQNLLKIGMSFTIEPGIYLPGIGGVRIEDDVIITENGCESLTDLSREVIQIE